MEVKGPGGWGSRASHLGQSLCIKLIRFGLQVVNRVLLDGTVEIQGEAKQAESKVRLRERTPPATRAHSWCRACFHTKRVLATQRTAVRGTHAHELKVKVLGFPKRPDRVGKRSGFKGRHLLDDGCRGCKVGAVV